MSFSATRRCSAVSLLIRSSHLAADSCMSFVNRTGAVCEFAAQAAYAYEQHLPESHDVSLQASYHALSPRRIALHSWNQSPSQQVFVDNMLQHIKHQWQQVARLSAEQAKQLMHRYPHLVKSCLHAPLNPQANFGFQASNLQDNLALLQSRGVIVSSDAVDSHELRGLLTLIHSKQLQNLLDMPDMQRLPAGAAVHRSSQQIAQSLWELLSRTVRQTSQEVLQQQQRRQVLFLLQQKEWQQLGHRALHLAQQHTSLQQQQQQLQDPAKALAASILQTLGIHPEQQVCSSKVPRLLRSTAAVDSCRSSSSSSSSNAYTCGDDSGTSPAAASAAAAAALSDQRRGISTASSSFTEPAAAAVRLPQRQQQQQQQFRCGDVLAAALARIERSVEYKGKAKLQLSDMHALFQQLQQHTQLQPLQLLELLLKRPAILYQRNVQQLPGQLLGRLQQQLPDLDCTRLVRQHPKLLSCSVQEVEGILQMLLGKLCISQQEVTQLFMNHPQLLQQPVKVVAMNFALLVGQGFKPSDVAAMLLGSPKWATQPLRVLTRQWQFLQEVAKVSLADVVACPQLLSLSVTSKIGPRLLFAQKRGIRLLMPSQMKFLPALPQGQWQELKMAPMQCWLTATDSQMCSAVGLSLEDYARFKTAWEHINGSTWGK